MSKLDRECSVIGCDRLSRYLDGLCEGHHARLLRHGDTQADVPLNGRPVSTCSVEGCDVQARSRRLCRRHYARFLRHGDPLGGGPDRSMGVPSIPALDPSWCDWFAGFCDGEACFRINSGTVSFQLKLRDDDAQIVYEIREVLGVGTVRRATPTLSDGRNSRPTIGIYVTGPSNVVVAEALRGRMRAKKLRDFQVWEEALMRAVQMSPRDPDRKPMMLEYKRKLEEVRKYGAA